ncbi:hypothetical protein KAFR_0G03100 [Kazachstania africana CBS 2517]|uniref:Uncharacterized protein n=1 Tax=Kazachstania africana (strain ATCC 22294 / BCRC 22015 / CBS 2517 / CECT 1963 / NBRC 1671 / NRRL Y-8276) TaxID=1071382 RepID=H2AY92_KAZAF|nr:hypothetical protein KAFR_0G03100 [Kazachstania africana CBS 2517]CCF59342.1 hypothetical protein KAFR_0G03100 [Kazachstania africana CBS 2517]
MILCMFLWIFTILPVISSTDIEILSPTLNTKYLLKSNNNFEIPIHWDFRNDEVPRSMTLKLCKGSNTNIQVIYNIASLIKAEKSQLLAIIPSDQIGINDIYFIQFYLEYPFGYMIKYSPRFKLLSRANIELIISTTLVPNAETKTTANVPATTTSSTTTSSSSSEITGDTRYTEQTGLTRYAPMQFQPQTKCNPRATWTKQYPKSSKITFYSTFRSYIDHSTTITPSWSYSIRRDVNHVSRARMPIKNGGWYNPTIRTKKVSRRKINN